MSNTWVNEIYQNLSVPVISAPMFIVSYPNLLVEQCLNGVVGSMPSLNARTTEQFDEWLTQINQKLDEAKAQGKKVAPYAINLIVHPSNARLMEDLKVCAKHKVPIIITSLSAPNQVAEAVHSWGGKVLHDVISVRHAQKALEAKVDGLILVATGAGGHAGNLSPFALLSEVREFFKGPIALSGCISHGEQILAALSMGADFAYMGTRFIATEEANASQEYKNMICDSQAKDIVYSPYFTGINGNYLAPSVVAAGFDLKEIGDSSKAPSLVDAFSKLSPDSDKKAWKDIWGAGQGVGTIHNAPSCATVIQELIQEYKKAQQNVGLINQRFFN